MVKKIDVLWLIEHIDRELDVACIVKAILEHTTDIHMEIHNIYSDYERILTRYYPRVVVHPFFYYVKGSPAQENYVAEWPEVCHFNLAWEQIHYKAHLQAKAPADDFSQKKVIHHAWGNFYRDYLINSGVPAENIFVNGQPTYQLYLPPYSRGYANRDQLALKYNLNPQKTWVFIPENYRWAFATDWRLKFTAERTDNPQEVFDLRPFSLRSLETLLKWCNQTALDNPDMELIFRPRPVNSTKLMNDFFSRKVGQPAQNLYITKGETVREWTLASDAIFSSYSTSLIEAAIAGKAVYKVEPEPIPEMLYCSWYDLVESVRTLEDFESACRKAGSNEVVESPLGSWARREMLAYGDPIRGLADKVTRLVEARRNANPPQDKSWASILMRSFYKSVGFMFLQRNRRLNQATHEKDFVAPAFIAGRIETWKNTLFSPPVDHVS